MPSQICPRELPSALPSLSARGIRCARGLLTSIAVTYCGDSNWVRPAFEHQTGTSKARAIRIQLVNEVGILSDIIQTAFLNFVVAAMAATSAVKGSSKLHTSMIRIGTQWLAACNSSRSKPLAAFLSPFWARFGDHTVQLGPPQWLRVVSEAGGDGSAASLCRIQLQRLLRERAGLFRV